MPTTDQDAAPPTQRAEAGWVATIAAIGIARHCIWNGHYQAGITAAREIIEAWPIELLKP